MKEKSLSRKLSWRIVVIVLIVSLVAQMVAAFVITDQSFNPWVWWKESPRVLLYLNIIGIVSLIVLFFVNRMVINRLTRYSEELRATKEANERLGSDLALARAIQLGMLPSNLPSFMYAYLNPAKEVGGDLYDFILKDDQLYFAVGDVSGKGLAASLVMAITSATLRLVVEMGLPMDETLRRINYSFSRTNKTGMFITMIVARIDLKTGHMDYCNAGHCPLLVMPPVGEPYLLKSKPNLVIGMFENFDYQAEQVDFEIGTRIIAYTDGVNEAERADLEQFGNERLLAWAKHVEETLPELSPSTTPQTSRDAATSEQAVVESLYRSVCDFAAGHPQNDDITILSIKLPKYMTTKRFNPITDRSSEIIGFLMASPDMPKDETLRFKIELSVEEAVENVVRYAYEGGIGWLEAGTHLDDKSLILTIELRDAGVPFNPLEKADPDVNLPANERNMGGLGIFLCKKMMDSIEYRYENGNNVLIMKKKVNNCQ